MALPYPIFEVPLTAAPQRFSISLGGTLYRLTFTYRDAPPEMAGGAGWVMDIADTAENPIACGLPLVTGHDLLEQFAYLNMGGTMFTYTDGNADAVPTFENLGSSSHLMWITWPPAPAIPLGGPPMATPTIRP